MIVSNEAEVRATPVESSEASRVAMKVLISATEGWEDHVMRVLEVEPGGYTPRHAHDWPHINYMISGSGTLLMDGRETPVSAGSYALVPAGMEHQFQNTGDEVFRFICIVPERGHY